MFKIKNKKILKIMNNTKICTHINNVRQPLTHKRDSLML